MIKPHQIQRLKEDITPSHSNDGALLYGRKQVIAKSEGCFHEALTVIRSTQRSTCSRILPESKLANNTVLFVERSTVSKLRWWFHDSRLEVDDL